MPDALEDIAMIGIARTIHATQEVVLEAYPRRVRGILDDETIVDSSLALLMLEVEHLPVYYFPLEDVRGDLLERSKRRSTCPRKGEATYFSIRVGERAVADAAWRYEHPIDGGPEIDGYLAFYWNALDSWWEEDDQVFVHARDPYKRVDVLRSSRSVRIELGGVTVAASRRPLLLFETGLPTRYYVPPSDVRLDLLRPSGTRTACPYKGAACYFSAEAGGQRYEDVAWTYPAPIPECSKIERLISFHNEDVDLYVDDELQERPTTPWSSAQRTA